MRWFVLSLILPLSFAHASRKTLSSDNEILAKSAVFKDLSDFRILRLDEPSRQLVNSLESDEFGDLKPFAHLHDYLPIGEILADGVVGYTRKTYRSPRFIWKQGYDVVRYEIETENSGTITLFAFRDSGPTPVGERDSRPVQLVLVEKNDSRVAVVTKYIDGETQPLVEASEDMQADLQNLDSVLENATPMTLIAP